MRGRLHYLFVIVGLAAGIGGAIFIETEPRILGWLFAIGAGLAGGAFLAAIVSNEPLAGGPTPRSGQRRGAPGRPAWFDEDDEDDEGTAPRNDSH